MNIIQKAHNDYLNSNNKKSQKSRIMILSKEDEELLNLINKYNISKNILNRDFQSPKKNKIEKNKVKLVDQIGAISSRILSEKTQEEKNEEKLINDLLYKNDFNCNLDKKGEKYYHLYKSQSSVKKKLLPKLSPQKRFNQLNKSKKDIFFYSRNYTDENYENERKSFFDLINSEKKNKNYYLLIKNSRNGKKQVLPPVNKLKWNYHKIKLDINNEIDHNDQKREEIMKFYKEFESKKKNRFVI